MRNSVRKALLQFTFSGAYMKRWNDKLRPTELIEIDKQAHKMIVAWLLCQLTGRQLNFEQRLALEEEVVEGGLFDYLFRLIITDIKPPVLYRIKENKAHYQQLAKWAIAEIEPQLRPLSEDLWQRFTKYTLRGTQTGPASKILLAAHLFSSAWEFQLLKKINAPFDDEVFDIEKRFTQQLAACSDTPGMPELIAGLERLAKHSSPPADIDLHPASSLARFANLCGQLRFQKRWSQTPRMPETSVMGHMFIVACYAYFLSIALGACPARRVNNFFCGLLHDLPELLTRDIISPVKKSSEPLEQLIREYEKTELELRVLQPLRQDGYGDICDRMSFYLGLETGSEFHETILKDGRRELINFDILQGSCNENHFDPKDGVAVKICDTLAAYIEAYTAMRNGTASDHIQQAFWRLRELNSKTMLGQLHIGALFTDFD